MALSTKRQEAVPRANSASNHLGIMVILEVTRGDYSVSHSMVLYTDSLGAGRANESFTEGIQQARAPSCPLPLLCSQIMQNVRMWKCMKELGTQRPYRKNCKKTLTT